MAFQKQFAELGLIELGYPNFVYAISVYAILVESLARSEKDKVDITYTNYKSTSAHCYDTVTLNVG